jgi:hypothetical protein
MAGSADGATIGAKPHTVNTNIRILNDYWC